jgi:hypothetical protein
MGKSRLAIEAAQRWQHGSDPPPQGAGAERRPRFAYFVDLAPLEGLRDRQR